MYTKHLLQTRLEYASVANNAQISVVYHSKDLSLTHATYPQRISAQLDRDSLLTDAFMITREKEHVISYPGT